MSNATLELEPLVDGYGLPAVVDALASICADKAEHIRANWQDSVTASTWEAAQLALEAAFVAISKVMVHVP